MSTISRRALSFALLIIIAATLFAAPSTLRPLFDVAEELGANDDRLQHTAIGAAVSFALAGWQHSIVERPAAQAVAIASAALGIGGLFESIQPAFDRQPELSDWGYHSIGSLLGVLVVFVVASYFAEDVRWLRPADHER